MHTMMDGPVRLVNPRSTRRSSHRLHCSTVLEANSATRFGWHWSFLSCLVERDTCLPGSADPRAKFMDSSSESRIHLSELTLWSSDATAWSSRMPTHSSRLTFSSSETPSRPSELGTWSLDLNDRSSETTSPWLDLEAHSSSETTCNLKSRFQGLDREISGS